MQLTMKYLDSLVAIARKAGQAILVVYGSDDFGVEFKDDDSPLTRADQRSHEIIMAGLSELTPDIPVFSEEGKEIPYPQRKDWKSFYLVDPLDGTKEFIKRNGEFTVNIALLEDGIPVAGVIYVPVKKTTYYAAKGLGAFKVFEDGSTIRISALKWDGATKITAVASRSHGSQEVEDFLSRYDVKEKISAGSSLKFCLVAEGKAHIYPRFGPTWEWDTAAGHAILKEAGARLVETDGSTEIAYNKETPKHKGFIASFTGAFPLEV